MAPQNWFVPGIISHLETFRLSSDPENALGIPCQNECDYTCSLLCRTAKNRGRKPRFRAHFEQRRYMATDTAVVVAPTSVPYGNSFKRSLTLMPTAPAVAWKKLPCGSASNIVPPA